MGRAGVGAAVQRPVVEQVYDHHGNVAMNTNPLLVFDA